MIQIAFQNGGDTGSCPQYNGAPIITVATPPKPDTCEIEIRYSEIVINGRPTGYNHTMLVGIDDTTGATLGVIDGHASPALASVGDFSMLFPALTPVVSTNGIYNNANTSTPFADSLSSASMCNTWSNLKSFAQNVFPTNVLYGGLFSNSNTLTSFLWLVAGQAPIGPPPGPNSTPGWNGQFVPIP
jgi:hypothetical protein